MRPAQIVGFRSGLGLFENSDVPLLGVMRQEVVTVHSD
jgi:hypothetical protein